MSLFKLKLELLLPWSLSPIQAQTQAFASLVHIFSNSSLSRCYLGPFLFEFELDYSMVFPSISSPQIETRLLYGPSLSFLSFNLNVLSSFPFSPLLKFNSNYHFPFLCPSSPRARLKLLLSWSLSFLSSNSNSNATWSFSLSPFLQLNSSCCPRLFPSFL